MDSSNKKSELQSIQLQQMLDTSRLYLLTTISLAAILTFMQWEVIEQRVVLSWFLLLVVITLSRMIFISYYQSSPVGDDVPILDRLKHFRLGVITSGLAWGSAGFLLFPEDNTRHQIFLIFMLTGLSVGGLILYSADFVSAAIYTVSVLAPLIVRLLFFEKNLSLAMSVAVVMYLVFLLLFLRHLNRNNTDNILMKLEVIARDGSMRESEERYHLLLNHSPVGIFHYDKNLVITYCNNIIAESLHSSLEIIVGLDMHTLKDTSFLKAAIEALKDDIGLYEGQYRATFSDASLWISMICSPSRNRLGDVVGGIGIVQDFTERKSATDEIKSLAFYDFLTGLPNRRLLLERLKQVLVSSARSGRSGALMYIDLDNFKKINDTFGHHIGDFLLQQVAQRILSCVRENDTVARLSGDEFVVILEFLSENKLEAAAQTEVIGEKIRSLICQPYQLAEYEHRSSPSIGVTMFSGLEQEADELMKQADIAMYQAKKAGRNILRFFDPRMQEEINARAVLERELHHALESNQFQLYYQIQVDSSLHLLGAEVLIRWLHPERGLVSPAQFIPLVEETGLILPIGQWVLETACDQIKAWQNNKLTRDLVLAVNISARQFLQDDFVDKVQVALHKHIINPRLLKLELTESLLLVNIEDIIVTMNALKEIGIQFSLDDFGTGYSSLQYLKRLPLDQLKIDQSFVRDLATSSSDMTIVSTIIAMAHSLNLEVIAEGVETVEQQQLLMDNGCSNFQGFLFGRPMPIDLFEIFLLESASQ